MPRRGLYVKTMQYRRDHEQERSARGFTEDCEPLIEGLQPCIPQRGPLLAAPSGGLSSSSPSKCTGRMAERQSAQLAVIAATPHL